LVLKLVPGHPEAERMGYIACELLMVETLKKGLALRNMKPEVQQAQRLAALKAGRKALAGKGDLERAWSDLREVAVYASDDPKVRGMLKSIEALRATDG